MNADDVIKAWNEAPLDVIHPAREHESEEAYWVSGEEQAEQLAWILPFRSRVIDFGCGDGRVAIPLQRLLQHHVIAVDASPKMINALRDREPQVPTLISDGSDLLDQLDGRLVDGLYCLAVLIHHDYDSGERLVGQLASVVRKGGILVLDWPASDAPTERKTWIEVTTWPEAQQARVAAQNGLQRVESDLPWSVWRRT